MGLSLNVGGHMGLRRAFKGFCWGFSRRVDLERKMRDSQKAVARELQRGTTAGFSTPERRKETIVDVVKAAFWLVVAVLVIVMIVYALPLVFSESPWAYALRYHADSSRVQVVPRPADCDWSYAPLGRKGCHYEKEVFVTRYSTDAKTGKPIVTYDDGKTWDWLPEGEKPGPVQVYVTWRKVRDGQ